MIINFNNKYNRNDWIKFLEQNFLPEDYNKENEEIEIDFQSNQIDKNVAYLGNSKLLNLKVYEMHHESENDPRIGLSRDAFKFIDHQKVKNALVLFISKNSDNYRFSLITREIKLDGKKVTTEYTNPKRFSYFVGPDVKKHTIE
ncbi:MAG: restriction endonuclease subunit M, partial [Patescibacteria group bacterium]|nr:restriction endonuclease subunit M [Patescibacteria group bacterium]